MAMASTIQPGDIIEEESLLEALSKSNATQYISWIKSLDAILVLGGGVPLSVKEPPEYVQRRCDVVAELFGVVKREGDSDVVPNIICLSAGTAHLPQYILPSDGLPLWEATSSAAYLMNHPKYPVDEDRLFVETTSYDTISNAFYARTSFTDVTGWRKLLVVTNEFHIHRSKAIFDWIFSVPSELPSNYKMYYLSCKNVGLTVDAIHARRSHEGRGESNVRSKLAGEYTTLHDVFRFLTTKHDFYTASKLVNRATSLHGEKVRDNLLELSYGKATHENNNPRSRFLIEIRDGRIFASVDLFTAVVTLIIISGACFATLSTRLNKPHMHIS